MSYRKFKNLQIVKNNRTIFPRNQQLTKIHQDKTRCRRQGRPHEGLVRLLSGRYRRAVEDWKLWRKGGESMPFLMMMTMLATSTNKIAIKMTEKW